MDNSSEKSTELTVPSYCCIAILESCFMHCKMCYKWQEDVNTRKPDEPILDVWKQAITDLAQLSRYPKPQINFAGGEPLAREETLSLISHAVALGFDPLLATNAYLIDAEKIKQIKKSHLKRVSISLDGVTPQTHDFLRGKEGSFNRTIKAIELLAANIEGMEINLCTVINAVNLQEIVELVKWASKDSRINGVGFQAITQPFNTPEEENWQKNPKYSFLWPWDSKIVNDVIDELIDIKDYRLKGNNFQIFNSLSQLRMFKRYFEDPNQFIKKGACHLDERAINITPTGQVHICFYKSPLGNIKNSSIGTMWNSKCAEEVRKQIKQCKKNCQAMINCNFDEQESYAE